jgi:hypothetical protein
MSEREPRERSKFRGILDVAKGRAPEPDDTLARPSPTPATASTTTPPAPGSSTPTPAAPPSPAPVDAPAARGPGRPRGKRSDPTFDQVTAYVPHGLYHRVRLALLEDDQGQEFSELVAELLTGWLAVRHRD